MNGRVYDYNIGRFLSVDPFLQFPENSQSANPYTYILNNPMSGTDPTGYLAETDTKEAINEPIEQKKTEDDKVKGNGQENEKSVATTSKLSRKRDRRSAHKTGIPGATTTVSLNMGGGGGGNWNKRHSTSIMDRVVGDDSHTLENEPLLYAGRDAGESAADFAETLIDIYKNPGKYKPKRVVVDSKKHPESAKHIKDAQNSGKPKVLTIQRKGKSKRRRSALKGIRTKKGSDRDEYPPAMFKEGGTGSSVRHINPSDNRGSGSCIGQQCRGMKDGQKVEIVVEDD